MGIEPYLLASALNGAVAQRLARTICPKCRTTYMPDRTALAAAGWAEDGPRVFYRGSGCADCHDSGFKGRAGIYEVVEMDELLYGLIHDCADEASIKASRRFENWENTCLCSALGNSMATYR